MKKREYLRNFKLLEKRFGDRAMCDKSDFRVVGIRGFPLPDYLDGYEGELMFTLPGITRKYEIHKYGMTSIKLTDRETGEEAGIHFIDVFDMIEDPEEQHHRGVSEGWDRLGKRLEKSPRERILLELCDAVQWILERVEI